MSGRSTARLGALVSALVVSASIAATARARTPAYSPPQEAAASASTAARPQQEFGLHQDLTYDGYAWRRAREIAAAVRVHAEVSRNSLLWSKIEPTQGTFDWSTTDSVVAMLRAKRIEPLFVLYGSPQWANGVATTVPDASVYVPAAGPAFDRWLSQYVRFVKLAVGRYKGRVEKWEVWNEENERFFWKPQPSVSLYARFYTTIRAAILSMDPRAQVAIGGLAGLCCSIDIPGIDFLRDLVDLNVRFDEVAIHPYSSEEQPPWVHVQWQNNFDDIGMIHRYLLQVQRNVPIWVTEWGWSTAHISPALQAQYVSASLWLLRTRYPYVTVATYFLDYDRGTHYAQGLFDTSFAPKPAAAAFAGFMNDLDATRSFATAHR